MAAPGERGYTVSKFHRIIDESIYLDKPISAHSMESHPKLIKTEEEEELKKINFQILPLKPVFIILALLIWYVVKQIWEYNNALLTLLSSGICYAPHVYS